jgi:hypothetical protein
VTPHVDDVWECSHLGLHVWHSGGPDEDYTTSQCLVYWSWVQVYELLDGAWAAFVAFCTAYEASSKLLEPLVWQAVARSVLLLAPGIQKLDVMGPIWQWVQQVKMNLQTGALSASRVTIHVRCMVYVLILLTSAYQAWRWMRLLLLLLLLLWASGP